MEIVNLPINQIKRDNNQPRQSFDEAKIRDMAQSIKTEGVINPIEIDKNHIIITGEMRWRASKLAGLKEVPCKIITIPLDERFRRQVIENIHHNTMTDWDTAKAIKKLLDTGQGSIRSTKQKKGGLPDKGIHELSRIIGKSEKLIIEKLDLLQTSPQFQKAVKQGMTASYLRAIKRTPDEYKKLMEENIVSGIYKTRDEAMQIADALKRYPEQAEKILKITSQEELLKIAPQISDQIRESYNPVNELSGIVDKLVDWLKNNPPQSVGRIHAPRILFNLSGVVNAVNRWGQEANQLKLGNTINLDAK